MKTKVTDPIADMFTRIRNGFLVGKDTVSMQYSNEKLGIATILKNEGFISRYEISRHDLNKKHLSIYLRYTKNNESVIEVIRRMSRPGKRLYLKKKDIPKVLNGFGIGIFSTNLGILSAKEARIRNVGGEYLGEVY